jgi:hypothetical protein
MNVFYSSRPSGSNSGNPSGSNSSNTRGVNSTSESSSGSASGIPSGGQISNRRPGNVMSIQDILNNPSQAQPEQSQTSTTQPNNNVAPNTDLSATWSMHNKIGDKFTVHNGVISVKNIPQNLSGLYDEEGKIKHNIENLNIINGFIEALKYHGNFFGDKPRLPLPNFDQESQRWFDIYKREVYLHRNQGLFFNSKNFRSETEKFSSKIIKSLPNNR